MADLPKEPDFETATYNTSFSIPAWSNRMVLGDVIAPRPNSAATARPTTGQLFPLGAGG